MMSPAYASSMIFLLSAISCWGWVRRIFFPPWTWFTSIPALKPSRTDAHERDSVTVGFIHIGLDLKHKGGKIHLKRIHLAVQSLSSKRGGGHHLRNAPERSQRRNWSGPSRRTRAKACPHATPGHVKFIAGLRLKASISSLSWACVILADDGVHIRAPPHRRSCWPPPSGLPWQP